MNNPGQLPRSTNRANVSGYGAVIGSDVPAELMVLAFRSRWGRLIPSVLAAPGRNFPVFGLNLWSLHYGAGLRPVASSSR
jgi:hypothetical protein